MRRFVTNVMLISSRIIIYNNYYCLIWWPGQYWIDLTGLRLGHLISRVTYITWVGQTTQPSPHWLVRWEINERFGLKIVFHLMWEVWSNVMCVKVMVMSIWPYFIVVGDVTYKQELPLIQMSQYFLSCWRKVELVFIKPRKQFQGNIDR